MGEEGEKPELPEGFENGEMPELPEGMEFPNDFQSRQNGEKMKRQKISEEI